jgi:hypothetical protein
MTSWAPGGRSRPRGEQALRIVVDHPRDARLSEELSSSLRVAGVAGVDAKTYVHTGIRTCPDKGGIYVCEEGVPASAVGASPVSGGSGCSFRQISRIFTD